MPSLAYHGRGCAAVAAALSFALAAGTDGPSSAGPPGPAKDFLARNCLDCHDAATHEGGLDLSALVFDPAEPASYAKWVRVHDRVRDGEMPPKDAPQPKPEELDGFLKAVAGPIAAADRAQAAAEGRATLRRLNRYEYENTLRDLLDAPWLQVKDMLPEDGEAYRFNKVGDALDVSHVQLSRYLLAAEYALREVIAKQAAPPKTAVTRYYARRQPAFFRKVKFNEFNRSPERATFPIVGNEADLPVLDEKAPMTVGDADPARRDLESMGVVASTYEPLEIRFDKFTAPVSGRYKLRFCAHTFWAGPESEKRWWHPDRTKVSTGRTNEPVCVYSETRPQRLRKIGGFDVTPEPGIDELDVHLLKGETIRPDAARLFRSRPPNWHNPLAEKDGQPGVAFRWMEAEGPILDQWPPAGHKLLFGALPILAGKDGEAEVVSENPRADAERLLRDFMRRAYRRPVEEEDVRRFLKVADAAFAAGAGFTDAMVTCYAAVLCSPEFVTLKERPGRLDDHTLAARLSYFLWNSEPDAELRTLADAGQLGRPEVLRSQAERLLDDPRSARFVEAFLDYWLDLRKADAASPDAALYPDYYLDDFLTESAVDETRAFFAELIRRDLPASNVADSDFVTVNSRLAAHYGLPPVDGLAIRPVPVPPDSPRGGLLTQAAVLKVTANGTTTSPVVRGTWVMERILGKPVPPPPPGTPAVEPDIRGAVTIRQQLEKHRSVESCNVCHSKLDPAGFALESFDVCGGWRDRYRANGDGEHPPGFGKNGQPFEFHAGPPVDPAGVLPDGREFSDIRELKRLLLADERQLARNLARQLTVYATGAPVRFGDRAEIESILDRTAAEHYGVRSLIRELIANPLFREK
jgi:hypothetical protein